MLICLRVFYWKDGLLVTNRLVSKSLQYKKICCIISRTALSLSVCGGVTAQAQTTASFLFSGNGLGSGNPISGKATFTILDVASPTQRLQIDFINTSPGISVSRGDVLSTILFNFTPGVVVTTANGGSNGHHLPAFWQFRLQHRQYSHS